MICTFYRYCSNCGEKIHIRANFCWKCNADQQNVRPINSDSDLSFGRPKCSTEPMSLDSFKRAKTHEQRQGCDFRSKKHRKSNEEAKESVTINIGIKKMDNDDLKTIRGKRLPITVSKTATYANIREKGIEKWKAFDRKFDSSADYVVLYEDGTRAQFMPGRRHVPYLEQLYFYSQKLWVCILLASFLLFLNISLGT